MDDLVRYTVLESCWISADDCFASRDAYEGPIAASMLALRLKEPISRCKEERLLERWLDSLVEEPPWLQTGDDVPSSSSRIVAPIILVLLDESPLRKSGGGTQKNVSMIPFPLISTPPVGFHSSYSASISHVVAEIWMVPGRLVDSILEAVFIVSPKILNLGSFLPTSPLRKAQHRVTALIGMIIYALMQYTMTSLPSIYVLPEWPLKKRTALGGPKGNTLDLTSHRVHPCILSPYTGSRVDPDADADLLPIMRHLDLRN